MKKLSLFGCVSAALVCAAVPVSFNWSRANVTLFSLDWAEARIGRPLTATSVAGVSRRVHRRQYRRAVAGAAIGTAAVGVAAADVGVPPPPPEPGPGVAVAGPYGGPGYGYGPGSSYFVCQAVGARSVGYGRAYFVADAKWQALIQCERYSGICLIGYCVPAY